MYQNLVGCVINLIYSNREPVKLGYGWANVLPDEKQSMPTFGHIGAYLGLVSITLVHLLALSLPLSYS